MTFRGTLCVPRCSEGIIYSLMCKSPKNFEETPNTENHCKNYIASLDSFSRRISCPKCVYLKEFSQLNLVYFGEGNRKFTMEIHKLIKDESWAIMGKSWTIMEESCNDFSHIYP